MDWCELNLPILIIINPIHLLPKYLFNNNKHDFSMSNTQLSQSNAIIGKKN